MPNYNPNIPQPGDDPSQSQGQILDNFTTLDTKFGVNHMLFSDNTNGGEHTKITFNNVSADPNPVTPKTGLYTKTVGAPAKQQLFFQNDALISQLTGPWLAASPGYATLPGGIIIAWGHNNALITGKSVSFTFITPAGFPSNCWVVTTAADSTTGGVAVTAQGITKTGFKAYDQFGGTAFSWIAIGN